MPTAVTYLRWADVDPARRPFDAGHLAQIVEQALLDVAARSDMTEREEAVDRALLAEFGPWIAGWRWSCTEPGCGGPVAAYCCADHSLCGDVAKDTATVVAAATDWRARLEALAGTFEDLREKTSALDAATTASHAASRLLPLILEWTGAEDAWYSTFEVVLAWFLELELGSAERALPIAKQAMSGRFHSWLAPEEPQRKEAYAAVAEATLRSADTDAPDALAEWLRQRPSVSWPRARYFRPGTVKRDGHERYIEDVDAEHDPARARRMQQALALARQAALEGKPLSLDLLAAWQETILGAEVAFRTTEAFAHGGAERYGIGPDTQDRFEACLAEANDGSLSVIGRAARAYLDVCNFHPFADGNARAARVALDFVLTANGLALHAAGPVFLIARRSLDHAGPYALAYVLDYVAGPRAS